MFSFNFDIPGDDIKASEKVDIKGNIESTSAESPVTTLNWEAARLYNVPKANWQSCLSEPVFLEEASIGDIKVKYLSQLSIEEKISSNAVSDALKESEEMESDLIPAVYEGGLKIWDCTWDLLQHLSKLDCSQFHGKRILELGCGAGLLGIYVGLRGASVTFQDYNVDVIKQITLPNTLYNVAELSVVQQEPDSDEEIDEEEGEEEDPVCEMSANIDDATLDELKQRVQFFTGDWGSFPAVLSNSTTSNECTAISSKESDTSQRSCDISCVTVPEESKFDMILASETIYNTENYDKLLNIFTSCLKPDGVILLAAKSYYFGVGGGTASFEAAVEEQGKLEWRQIAHNTSGVHKEIIQLNLLQ